MVIVFAELLFDGTFRTAVNTSIALSALFSTVELILSLLVHHI
jgi:hypothetical protein